MDALKTCPDILDVLPAEIIGQIVDNADEIDYIMLTKTCKRLHAMGRPTPLNADIRAEIIAKDYRSIFLMLLPHYGRYIDIFGVFMMAVRNDSAAIVSWILGSGHYYPEKSYECHVVSVAAKYGSLNVLKVLRRWRFPINCKTCNLSEYGKNRIEIVKWLDTVLPARSYRYLLYAVRAADSELFGYLIENNYPMNKKVSLAAAKIRDQRRWFITLVDHGCPWDPVRCRRSYSPDDVLDWLDANTPGSSAD